MPEETQNYIHIPVRDAGDFVESSYKTISISEEKGIKAIIGNLKSDPEGSTHIKTFLFAKDPQYGWTMASAQEWVDAHKNNGVESDTIKTQGGNDMNDITEPTFYASKMNKQTHFKYLAFDTITKSAGASVDESGGKRYLSFFTSDKTDEMGDVIERAATEKAIGKYKRWGNIRYMHQPIAVGTVRRIGAEDSLDWNQVEFEITHDDVANDIDKGVLKAMSVGILVNGWEFINDEDKKTYAGLTPEKQKGFFGPMRITEYDLVEISVVDHPANYDAFIQGTSETKNFVRKVLFQRDPDSDFDLALNKFQLERSRFDVEMLDDTPGTRRIKVLDKEDNSTMVLDEKDGVVEDSPPVMVESDKQIDSTVDLSSYHDMVVRANKTKTEASATESEPDGEAVAYLELHRSALGESLGLTDVHFEQLRDDGEWGLFQNSDCEKTWQGWKEHVDRLIDAANKLAESKTSEPNAEVQPTDEPVTQVEATTAPESEKVSKEEEVAVPIEELPVVKEEQVDFVLGKVASMEASMNMGFAAMSEAISGLAATLSMLYSKDVEEKGVPAPVEEKVAPAEQEVVLTEKDAKVQTTWEKSISEAVHATELEIISLKSALIESKNSLDAQVKDLAQTKEILAETQSALVLTREELERAKMPRERKSAILKVNEDTKRVPTSQELAKKSYPELRGLMKQIIEDYEAR